MKQNFKLTKDQQTLVEKNLSIVHWVIVNNIHVNPGICGLEYSPSSSNSTASVRGISYPTAVKRIKWSLYRLFDLASAGTL